MLFPPSYPEQFVLPQYDSTSVRIVDIMFFLLSTIANLMAKKLKWRWCSRCVPSSMSWVQKMIFRSRQTQALKGRKGIARGFIVAPKVCRCKERQRCFFATARSSLIQLLSHRRWRRHRKRLLKKRVQNVNICRVKTSIQWLGGEKRNNKWT